MKNIFTLFAFQIILIQIVSAQNQIWALEGHFIGKISADKFENQIPDEIKGFYEPFLANNKQQVQVDCFLNSQYAKAVTNKNEIALLDKKDQSYFNYQQGDDVISKDRFSSGYTLSKDGEQLSNGKFQLHNLEEIKDIAGKTCRKANLVLNDSGKEVKLVIWYTEDIPSLLLPAYPLFSLLPGAVLKMEIPQDSVGFEIQSIAEVENNGQFDLPKSLKILRVDTDADYANGGLFEESFALNDGLKWVSIKDSDSGDEYYGIQNEIGKQILPMEYFSLEVLNNDYAVVSDKQNQYWIINKNGQLKNKSGYDLITLIGFGRAIFIKNDRYGILDEQLKEILSNEDNISPLTDDLLVFSEKNLFGIMDMNGHKVIKPEYANIETDDQGNIILQKQMDGEVEKLTLEKFKSTYVKK